MPTQGHFCLHFFHVAYTANAPTSIQEPRVFQRITSINSSRSLRELDRNRVRHAIRIRPSDRPTPRDRGTRPAVVPDLHGSPEPRHKSKSKTMCRRLMEHCFLFLGDPLGEVLGFGVLGIQPCAHLECDAF